MREEKMEGFVHEAEKPLARYKDDNDLDKMMREMDREGDPMAAFLKKKKKKEDPVNGWLNFLLYALALLGSKIFFFHFFKENSRLNVFLGVGGWGQKNQGRICVVFFHLLCRKKQA
jgi:hypothetical protein